MSERFGNASKEVFKVLKGMGKTLTLYDDYGNIVMEPKEARKLFVTPDNTMITIDDDGANSSIKMYINGGSIKDPEFQNKIRASIQNIANKYNLLFVLKTFNKDLSPKMFANQAKNITESQRREEMNKSPRINCVRNVLTFREASVASMVRKGLFEEYGHGPSKSLGILKSKPTVLYIYEDSILENALQYIKESYGYEAQYVTEASEDKFADYATQWVKSKMDPRGMDFSQGGDDEALSPSGLERDNAKRTMELTKGLKDIITGKLNISVPPGTKIPQFTNPNNTTAFALGLALDKFGDNDTLFNYLSDIADRLNANEPVDRNEKFFADRVADMVMKKISATESIDEETDSLGSNFEQEFEKILDNVDILGFMRANNLDREGGNASRYNEICRMILAYYRGEKLDAAKQASKDFAKFLKDNTPKVISLLKKKNVPFSVDTIPQNMTVIENDSVNFQNPVVENDCNDGGCLTESETDHFEDLKDVILKALSEIPPDEYYGIVYGEDALEEAYNLLPVLRDKIISDLGLDSLEDHIDEIMDMAKNVWNPSVEEAVRPSDYDRFKEPEFKGENPEVEDQKYMDALDTGFHTLNTKVFPEFDSRDAEEFKTDPEHFMEYHTERVMEVVAKTFFAHYGESLDGGMYDDVKNEMAKAIKEFIEKMPTNEAAIGGDMGDNLIKKIRRKPRTAADKRKGDSLREENPEMDSFKSELKTKMTFPRSSIEKMADELVEYVESLGGSLQLRTAYFIAGIVLTGASDVALNDPHEIELAISPILSAAGLSPEIIEKISQWFSSKTNESLNEVSGYAAPKSLVFLTGKGFMAFIKSKFEELGQDLGVAVEKAHTLGYYPTVYYDDNLASHEIPDDMVGHEPTNEDINLIKKLAGLI